MLFQHCIVVLDGKFNEVEQLLKQNGASVIVSPQKYPLEITHLITNSNSSRLYKFANAHLVPAVSPDWVEDSVREGKLQLLSLYSSNANRFLRTTCITLAQNFVHQDKMVLETAISALGGQYSPWVTRYTTHVISDDATSDECLIAQSVPLRKINCVSTEWLIQSLKYGKIIQESDFPVAEPSTLSDSVQALKLSLFKGKKFEFSKDLDISDHIEKLLGDIVIRCGGEVGPGDCIVSKYRRVEFSEAVNGNLRWFFDMIGSKQFRPVTMLHHKPAKKEPIRELKGLTFSLTNYFGDQRGYLEALINAMGGKMIKTLTREVDYLICGKLEGEKYEAVKSMWPHIKITSHLWIEECFKQWRFVEDRFDVGSYEDEEGMISGRFAKIEREDEHREEVTDQSTINIIFGKEKTENVDENSDEKVGNENDGKADKENSNERVHEKVIEETPDNSKEIIENHAIQNKPTKPTNPSETLGTSQKANHDLEDKENKQNQQTPKGSRTFESPKTEKSSRQAAVKAAARLHSDMEDLNQYQKQLGRKSHKKMKKDHLKIITTGCDEFSRSQLKILEEKGIEIVDDPRECNVIVAPRVMRTEKFLTGLSTAPKAVVVPEYLQAVIANSEPKLEDFLLDTGDENLSMKEILSRARDTVNSGKGIFYGMKFNATQAVPGGSSVINRILGAHGMSEKLNPVKNPVRSQNLKVCDQYCYLLTQDGKLEPEFIKACNKLKVKPIVVEWEWVVQSIFAMKRGEIS